MKPLSEKKAVYSAQHCPPQVKICPKSRKLTVDLRPSPPLSLFLCVMPAPLIVYMAVCKASLHGNGMTPAAVHQLQA